MIAARPAPLSGARASARAAWLDGPLGVGLAMALPVIAVQFVNPPSLGVLVLLVAAIPWLAKAPHRGLYIVLAAATGLEIFGLAFPDSLTDRTGIFLNLSASPFFKGLAITPMELLLLTLGALWVIHSAGARINAWRGGPLTAAYVALTLCVIVAEIRGLMAGGDFNISLWEARPQVYGFVAFVLATSMVRDRSILARLAMVLLVAAVLKAGVADWRYFVTLHGDLGGRESVLSHEDSFFLVLYLTATLASAIWYRASHFRLLLLGAAPVTAALLVNERRAGIAALAVAIGVLAVLAIRYEREQRGRLLAIAGGLGVAGTAYVVLLWNHTNGATGQLVRAVRSVIDPASTRDSLSDLYRVAENANLRATLESSPVLGIGFGLPFHTPFPMADISKYYSLWNYIPHDTIMWVGVRMGIVGYLVFWCLVGLAILQAIHLLGTSTDPLLRAFAGFAAAAIAAELIVGYTDLQLENYRNMLFLGGLFGVLNCAAQLRGIMASRPAMGVGPGRRDARGPG
ncbi:MAG TPA: O-antigen ligase family protein [Candidatus Dormibacteraeota bacterium]